MIRVSINLCNFHRARQDWLSDHASVKDWKSTLCIDVPLHQQRPLPLLRRHRIDAMEWSCIDQHRVLSPPPPISMQQITPPLHHRIGSNQHRMSISRVRIAHRNRLHPIASPLKLRINATTTTTTTMIASTCRPVNLTQQRRHNVTAAEAAATVPIHRVASAPNNGIARNATNCWPDRRCQSML